MNFFIKSYGCQMNAYDSDRMTDELKAFGYSQVMSVEEADIVVLNTCSIREKADDKLYSDLGRVKAFKDRACSQGSRLVVVVTGCVAQTQSEEMKRRMPYVDIILGPQDIHLLADYIDKILKNDASQLVSIGLNTKDKFEKLSNKFFTRDASAYITVQEGCDNFCTYCVVPHTRGREFSRDVSEIIAETKMLVDIGVKEIILIGQNVNSYRSMNNDIVYGLDKLLYEVANVSGVQRLRYITSNPKDIDENIARAHRDIPSLMPFLHLPVQSGSDEILRRMNRKYNRAKYIECIDMLRSYKPDLAFSSDFIVGFPGENDQDFADTIAMINQVKYAQAYSFKYSKRDNTPAAKMIDQVSDDIKSQRLQVLQTLLNNQQAEFNNKSVGTCVNVLFTKEGKYENQFVGRSEYSQAVSVCDQNIKPGNIHRIKVTEVVAHSLRGVII